LIRSFDPQLRVDIDRLIDHPIDPLIDSLTIYALIEYDRLDTADCFDC